jgi:acyl-CoA dehydrogenase
MAGPTPPFTEEHDQLRESLRGFIAKELRPHAMEWEEARWFPNEVFPKLAANGFLGLKYPEELGGQGGDYLHEAVMCEEMARIGSGGTAAGIGAHVNIATPPVFKFGTDDQKERYLRPAIAGEKIAALGITEPDAGSDVASIRTKAERVDGGYIVNGAKTYITNGVRADFYVTAVRTGGDGHSGLSFLVLERGEGIAASALSKLGWRASDTAEIAFDEVFVPREHLLGELDGGFKLIMANFQWERLVMALGAVGAMRRTLERAVVEPAGQAYRHRIADLATRAAAGTALTYHALRRFLDGGDAVREVTMAKLATQRANFELQDECLRLLGPDPELERAVRDARLGPIGGGTDEIMREILARTLTS